MIKHMYKGLTVLIVSIGLAFCGFAQTTNTYPFPASGSVGIGTTTPTALLEIKNAAQEGAERLMKFNISDASEDFLTIDNGTGVNGQFMHSIKGTIGTASRYALVVSSNIKYTEQDNGDYAAIPFDARMTSSKLNNRPLFVWQSYTTPY